MIRLAFNALAAALLALLLILPGTALGETRVALVVANSDYEGAPLGNPQTDLGLVVPVLERAGFRVTAVSNAGLAEFDAALTEFADAARGADIALFYFAGHGFALNSGIEVSSYLMSTDADVSTDSDRVLMSSGIALDAIVRQMTASARVSLVFVDACRNDPRVRSIGSTGRGLAPLGDVNLADVFVGLSTRVGDTAADGIPGQGSPFARAFIEHIAEPGVSVDRAFNNVRLAVQRETGTQRPEAGRNDLTNPARIVLLAGAQPAQAQSGTNATAPGGGTDEAAARAWLTTQNSDSIAVLRRFAEIFAGTFYADLALARAEELEALETVPQQDQAEIATAAQSSQTAPSDDARFAGLPSGQQSLTELLAFPAATPGTGPFGDACIDPATPGAGNTVPACQRAVRGDPQNAGLQFLLGRAYGFAGDYARALQWYGQAASTGHAQAMLHAGIFYRDGIGVTPDTGAAANWFELSARNGNSQAMAFLGDMKESAADYGSAARWYQQGAEGGNALAMLRLGRMYLRGVGVAQDYALASRWLERAVANGSRDAYTTLAELLSNGPATLRNDRRAADLILSSLSYKAEGSEADIGGNFSRYGLETRKEMQRLLQSRGAYSGAIDGVFGKATLQALQQIFSGPAGN